MVKSLARALSTASVLIAAVLCATAASAAARPGPTASTHDGTVRGRTVKGVDEFLGIPYAAPPVGQLRWRPPQPAAPWPGVRPATTLPPTCPQLKNSNGPRSTDENCLYLSVYRPRGTTAHTRLPVLFWIHGGGLTTGSGNQHNGSLFATTDHIMVVSINYRLGVFGFLALPSLNAEAGDHASGDYGLLDQEAALRWVHANIAAFGGNPRNVTIAGESAGGYSVCSLLASPPVRGLFSHAVIQSGSCATEPLAAAQRTGTAFARAAGCRNARTAATCLRRRSAGALLDNRLYPSADIPTAGGRELPVPPATAVARGGFTRVPLLIGTNHNEGRTFSEGYADDPESTYVKTIDTDYGPEAAKVLAEYPWSSFPSPYTTAYALGAVWTDSAFFAGIGGCGTQNLAGQFAKRTPTFVYQFDDLHAPGLNTKFPGYQWGAGHAMELAYMWPSFDNGTPLYPQLTAAQKQLSNEMVRYWGAFARSGAPVVAGQTPWPGYQTSQILSLQPGDATTPISAAQFAGEHNCAFWDALPGQPG
jgi:carboxylesterase type B